MTVKPGDVLGHYRLTEHLAGGGMARLYRAVDARDGREVVVKLLPASADAETRERFAREIRVLAELDHPRIVPLLDTGTVDDAPYLVLPLVDRGDLADRIAREDGPLPLPLVRRIALQLCDALAYAHLRGVVHRDLKPANVLVDAAGDVQLADFGIALAAGNARLTQAGQAIGTPEYLAPEQALGVADMRSDVYALGLILFQLATGRLPFAARTPAEWLAAHRELAPPSPRSLNAGVPEPFERVVLRALAKKPEARFQSAAEMAAALRQALPEDATPTLVGARPPGVAPAAPPTTSTSVAPDPPSNLLPVLAMVVLVAVLATAGWLVWRALAREAAVPVATTAAPAPSARAPSPPPVTPAVAPPAAAQHYDDFADATHDGAFDGARWRSTSGDERLAQRQSNGVLRVRTALRDVGLAATRVAPQPRRIAVRVRLLDPVLADEATIGVTLLRADQPGTWVACYLYATRGALRATPTCTDQRRREYRTGSAVNTGAWVELSLRPDGKEGVDFNADADAIGALPLVQDGAATWLVFVAAWSGDGKAVEGEVDWVDIEP
ncbi:serine/threonine-protein kinase [Tahibacter soli]|uniref:non-specific serine/threonine protein kinase n=1 Tax=Tahibacter soli TaxID=2983605 RepID=A0A9X3YLB4_9GAMM|nr:serine/threonine-protein kinase [Tahibacter soli]MDC8013712.1 serine/threonine-protein kinase [Tahibacter soli]